MSLLQFPSPTYHEISSKYTFFTKFLLSSLLEQRFSPVRNTRSLVMHRFTFDMMFLIPTNYISSAVHKAVSESQYF